MSLAVKFTFSWVEEIVEVWPGTVVDVLVVELVIVLDSEFEYVLFCKFIFISVAKQTVDVSTKKSNVVDIIFINFTTS